MHDSCLCSHSIFIPRMVCLVGSRGAPSELVPLITRCHAMPTAESMLYGRVITSRPAAPPRRCKSLYYADKLTTALSRPIRAKPTNFALASELPVPNANHPDYTAPPISLRSLPIVLPLWVHPSLPPPPHPRCEPLEPLPSETHDLAIRIVRTRDLAVPRPSGRVPDIDGRAGQEGRQEVGGNKEVGGGVGWEGEV
jgi:hypothetical protein